jgi:hypothetical protein
MVPKRILVPARLRRPPSTGWAWVDRRFVREHMDRLSPDAVALYFLLTVVADRDGLSFYSDAALAALLRFPPARLPAARDELLARDLIAHEARLTQVLSLPPQRPSRRAEHGQGPLLLGELLRQAMATTSSDQERATP